MHLKALLSLYVKTEITVQTLQQARCTLPAACDLCTFFPSHNTEKYTYHIIWRLYCFFFLGALNVGGTQTEQGEFNKRQSQVITLENGLGDLVGLKNLNTA